MTQEQFNEYLRNMGGIAQRGIQDYGLFNIGAQAGANLGLGMTGALGLGFGLPTLLNKFGVEQDPFYRQFAEPGGSPYGLGSPGSGLAQDRYGINTISMLGDYGKYSTNKYFQLAERARKGQLSPFLEEKKDYYADVMKRDRERMITSDSGFEDSGGGYSQSSVDAGVQAAEDDI